MTDRAHQERLLTIAIDSIRHGVAHNEAIHLDHARLDDALLAERASFVTLQEHGDLRGCIGTLEAVRPLADDVAHNAWAAAFRDPRFPRVTADEIDALDIHISILDTPTPMDFADESDLLAQIRPGVDGLILEADGHRGTFLPSVWESLPDTQQFFDHLKRKAGLEKDYWSDQIRVDRYTVEEFS